MTWQNKIKKYKKRLLTALAAMVVFVTTYALIIPAITLEQEVAEQDPGIVFEESASEYTPEVQAESETYEETEQQTEPEQPEETDSFDEPGYEEQEENTEAEILMPEMTLKYEIGEITIFAEVPEGSLPEGARLEVTPVEDDEKLERIKAAVDEETKIDHITAFDIRFLSAEGEETEPLAPVKVSMISPEIEKAEETVIVRLNDEWEEPEIMRQTDEETEENEVAFENDRASVFGFVFTPELTEAEPEGEASIEKEETEAASAEGTQEALSDEAEAVVLMPEMTLKSEIGDVTILAEVREGSLPDGTTLEVTRVEDEDTLERIETAVDEETKIDHVAAFDIRFITPDGEEVEPLSPVRVSMISPEVEEAKDTLVVHLDDETLESEVMQQVDEKTEDNEVAFESASFSVYGFVFTQKLTATVLTKEGETYVITVSLDENSGIPEDAELVVTELESDSEEYEEHLKKSKDALNMNSEDPVRLARFFDIEIRKDGEKLEPATPAKVELTYVDPLQLQEGENLSIVHFADSGIEVIENTEVNEEQTKITYEQESFSVTGTIVQGTLGNGQQGMLIVRDKNGEEYIILSDGTLEPVNKVAWDQNQFTTDNPMIWKYTNDTYYHETRAYDFNNQDIASDFYYSYINAKESDGIGDDTYENINPQQRLNNPPNPDKQGKTIGDWSHRDMWPASATLLENHHMRNRDPENGQYYYIGVERGTDGKPVRITGRNTLDDAAEIYLATTSIPSSDPGRNRVNHIDISIKSQVTITYPLARGVTYYDKNGNPYTPTGKTNVTLSQEVGIKTDDMRRATISAFTKDTNGTKHTIDNVFYITGYSANAETQYSTDQVRIEGSFKVTTTDSTNWSERIKPENRIYYSVEASKPVSFNVTDPAGNQLYDESGNPITVTVNVSLSASFDYWDERNECPPVRWTLDSWRQGDIMSHGLSGMDFVMGGDTDLNTLEIIKQVEDENGNLIEMPAGTQLDHEFDVYQRVNGQWYQIDTKTAEVSDHGIGFTSDYGVPDGSYVIRENTNTIPKTITDKNGETWIYSQTYFETEGKDPRYWPNDHDKWGADPNLYESEAGVVGQDNRDVQFTCHNIYVKKTSVEVKKLWYRDGQEADAPEGAEITVTLGRYVKIQQSNPDDPDPIDPDPIDPPTPERIKAKIDIYRSNYGHQTEFSNDNSFYAGQTLHITLNKQKQANVSYTINNGQKVTLPVENGNSQRQDYSFDVVVPADGILNIALDDAWSDVQNIRVVAGDVSNSMRRAPSAIKTENITWTQDGEAPEGYRRDTGFAQPLILSATAGWTRKVGDLDSKDANGNEYLYYIAKIEEKNVPEGTIPAIQEPQTTTGEEPLEVHNILPTPKVDISFGKLWYGADQNTITNWPEDVDHISVKIRRYYESEGEKTYDPNFNMELELRPRDGDGYSVQHNEESGEYKFTVKELEQYSVSESVKKPDWIYEITESELTDYYIKYRAAGSSEEAVAEHVTDGGIIENHLNVYELPHTGGMGTPVFTLTGEILFIFGLFTLLCRLFRERRSRY